MKKLSCKEIQKKSLQLLVFFNEYTQKNNLTYYLSGGTLLGAVRHKGFIPWDDDVDIMMPRKDYERLIQEFEETEQYCVSSYENDPEFENRWARIWDKYTERDFFLYDTKRLGVYLDIFPLDGYPDSRLLSVIHDIHLRILVELWNTYMIPGPGNDLHFKRIRKVIRRLFYNEPRKMSKKINETAMKYDYEKCNYVGPSICMHYMFKERNRKEIYKPIFLPFEGGMFPAPAGYDIYLKKLYGDYMQLPPEEKRVSNHAFVIWEKEPVKEE